MPKFIVYAHANVFNGTLESDLQRDVAIITEVLENGEELTGTIIEVGPVDSVTVPDDSQVIDLSGKYVIPGLINAHAHLFGTGKPMTAMSMSEELQNFMVKGLTSRVFRGMLKSRMRKNAQTALNAGVTTIRTAGDMGGFDVDLRDEFLDGKKPGPRLVAAGKSICITGGHGAVMAHIIDDPWAGRKAVRECLRHGSDVIKILSTGGVMDAKRLGEAGRPQMTVPEIEAICDEAHRGGYKVMTHCESTQGIREALAGGVDSIEHGAPIPDDLIPLFKDSPKSLNGYTTLISTISAPADLCELGVEVLKITDVVQQNSMIIRDGVISGLQTAAKNDIALGMGTDASVPFVPHYEFWRELIYYQHFAQLSNKQVINIATEQNAKLLGIDKVTGTLETGKSADFIVLNDNPLVDLMTLGNVVHVTYRGNYIEEPKFKKIKEIEEHHDKRFFEKIRQAT